VPKKQIMVAVTAGDSIALGSIWRLTAKKTDFYLDPHGDVGRSYHLSMHGPNDRFDGHRFHIKADPQSVAAARAKGKTSEHFIPRRGIAFDGEPIAGTSAFRVARIRWTWHVQRPRFRPTAMTGRVPKLSPDQSGTRLTAPLSPNDAFDIDVFVSYDEPYWPHAEASLRRNARLGPLQNAAGLWLTATTWQRSQLKYPPPSFLYPRPPRSEETPELSLTCGISRTGLVWCVETITSTEHLEATGPVIRRILALSPVLYDRDQGATRAGG
jgi:hypothetical protein